MTKDKKDRGNGRAKIIGIVLLLLVLVLGFHNLWRLPGKNPYEKLKSISADQIMVSHVAVGANKNESMTTVKLTQKQKDELESFFLELKPTQIKKERGVAEDADGDYASLYLRLNDSSEVLMCSTDRKDSYQLRFDEETGHPYIGTFEVVIPGFDAFVTEVLAEGNGSTET